MNTHAASIACTGPVTRSEQRFENDVGLRFDRSAAQENNQVWMRSRLAVRSLAFAIATTFSWSLWIACAEAAIPNAGAQMACCKDGELTCAPNSSGKDCCQIGSARPRDAIAGAKIDPVHILIAVVAWAVIPNIGTTADAQARFHPPLSPSRIDPGPPPYIAFSSLLI